MARKPPSGGADAAMATPSVRQGKRAGQRLATPADAGKGVQPTGRAGRAQPARNPRTKAGRSADSPPARDPLASWSDAERAEFVRAVLDAGPHGPELREAIAEHARWRDVLGDELTHRVARLARLERVPAGDLARDLLAAAVGAAEDRHRLRAATDTARAACSHPEKDRRRNRCGACGTRGLPALT